MKITYRYTFSQFTDHFIAQYYSGGIRVFTRLMGRPKITITNPITRGNTRQVEVGFGYYLLWGIGLVIALFGLLYFVRPGLQLLFVRSRKDEFFGTNGEEVELTLDLEEQLILIKGPDGESDLPLTEILYIQHRSESSWIITDRDHTIPIPRHELLSGDHDAFISAIEEILDINEQKH